MTGYTLKDRIALLSEVLSKDEPPYQSMYKYRLSEGLRAELVKLERDTELRELLAALPYKEAFSLYHQMSEEFRSERFITLLPFL